MDDEQANARAAHSSAAIQALLVLAVLGIVLLSQQTIALGRLVDWGRGIHGSLALGALCYLLATWRQPQPRAAQVIFIVLLLPVFPLVAWTSVRWQQLGRPWEAFPALQVAIMSMALIVPRSFWAGVAFVVALALEALGIVVWFRSVGVNRYDIPITEPYSSFIIAVASIGLLRMREQRRVATERYLVTQSGTLMLEGLTGTMLDIRARFRAATRALLSGTEDLAQQHESEAVVARMHVALGRLGSLNGRLNVLDTTRVAPAGAGPTHFGVEERFLAQDAHDSALLLTGIALASSVLGIVALHDEPVGIALQLYTGFGLLAAGLLVFLLLTRAHPSERAAIVVFMAIFIPLFGLVAVMSTKLARLTTPIELFTGPKLSMAIIPLVVPRSRWLGIAFVALMGIEAIALYELLDLASQKHRIAMAEPWITLVYCVVGVMLVLLHDEGRCASVRLLRAEANLKALARRSRLLLAILDETGSPLQVLTVSLSLLRVRAPSSGVIPEMVAAIDQFATARTEMTQQLRITEWPLALDSARELNRLSDEHRQVDLPRFEEGGE